VVQVHECVADPKKAQVEADIELLCQRGVYSEEKTSLDLGNARLAAGDVATIALWLKDNGVLTDLNLYDNSGKFQCCIGDEGAMALASALRVNEVLINLDVRRNKISGDAAQPLATAVLASSSLEIFGSVPLKELRANTLDKLALSGHALGVPEALVLAKLVEGSGVLKELNLRANSIGPTGATALADALKVKGVLKTLNLRDNNIRAEGAAAIAEALRGNEVLTSLDVRGNKIGPTGATAIADALKGSAVLKALDIGGNDLGDEGAKAIRDAVSGREGFELEIEEEAVRRDTNGRLYTYPEYVAFYGSDAPAAWAAAAHP